MGGASPCPPTAWLRARSQSQLRCPYPSRGRHCWEAGRSPSWCPAAGHTQTVLTGRRRHTYGQAVRFCRALGGRAEMGRSVHVQAQVLDPSMMTAAALCQPVRLTLVDQNSRRKCGAADLAARNAKTPDPKSARGRLDSASKHQSAAPPRKLPPRHKTNVKPHCSGAPRRASMRRIARTSRRAAFRSTAQWLSERWCQRCSRLPGRRGCRGAPPELSPEGKSPWTCTLPMTHTQVQGTGLQVRVVTGSASVNMQMIIAR
eukprot:358421-Chlamydomonas_euryale.AAC.11